VFDEVCPLGSTLGASLLPFGLLAGVSANALSAGLDLTGVTAPQGGPTGFSAALAAFEQAGAKRSGPEAETGPDGSSLYPEGEAPSPDELPGELVALAAPAEPVQLPVDGDILVGPNQVQAEGAGLDTNGQAANRGSALPDPGVNAAPSAPGQLDPGAGGEAGNNRSAIAASAPGAVLVGSFAQPPQAQAAAALKANSTTASITASIGPGAATATTQAAAVQVPSSAVQETGGKPTPAAVPGSATADETLQSFRLGAQSPAGVQAEPESGAADPVKQTPAGLVSAEQGRQRRWQTELPEVARSVTVRPSGSVDAGTPTFTTGPTPAAPSAGDAATASGIPAIKSASGTVEPVVPEAPKAGAGASAGTSATPSAVQVNATAPTVVPEVPVADDAAPEEASVTGTNRSAIPAQETSAKPASVVSQQAGPQLAGQGASGPADAGMNIATDARSGLVQTAKQTGVASQPVPEGEADLGDDGVDPGEIPAGNLQRKPTGTAAASPGAAAVSGAAKPAVTGGAPGVEPATAAALDADAAIAEDAFDSDLPLVVTARSAGQGGEFSVSRGSDGLQNPTQAQSGQVATQVAAEVARNLRNGQTRFQMRFDPPELGRVDVNLKVARDGSVQAHLIVERPETLDMFLRDQRGLERALEAAGLNADSENLKFSLNDNGSGQSAFAQDENAEGGDRYAGDAGAEDDGDHVMRETVELSLQARQGGLDIRI
jgi:flagellar hook-length control protein FliK